MKEKVDLTIINASEIITCKGNVPKKGEELKNLSIIKNGGIAIDKGRILDVGESERIRDRFTGKREIDLKNESIVLPGFVESHTHLVFGGTREEEFLMRLSGASYLEIQKRGGGIYSTVRATKSLEEDKLIERALSFIEKGEKYGISTFEIKSGYGLYIEDEIRILKIIKEIKKRNKDIISTFLLHLPPEGVKRSTYFKKVIENLKLIKDEELSDFVDIFVEKDAFSKEEAYIFLSEAKKLGFKTSMHVDQFNNIGGIDVAIDLNLNSVSHLDKTDKESLKELSKKDTVGIIFPTERMFLLKDGKLGRRVADSGVPLAISTDFNPGTSPTINFYLALSLSVIREGLSIEEAINASTINPAFALSIHEDRGSIEKGKLANLQILSLKTYKLIPYFFGMNYLKYLIKDGEVKHAF